LPVTFRDVSNCRIEMLTFDVVDFSGPYHVILGWLCYVNFMAISSYTYLKLKIPRLAGIITVEAKTQRALDCEQDNIELALATVVAAKLKELCPNTQPSSTDSAIPSPSDTFQAAGDAKAVWFDVEDPAKMVGAGLDLKEEGELIDFLRYIKDVYVWRPADMSGVS
jgi:hypothetical protein